MPFDGTVSSAIALDLRDLTVVAATSLEARALRRALPKGIRLLETGIALRTARPASSMVIGCGLAGGVRDTLPTGTVVIPRFVGLPDGTRITCDAELNELLVTAAARLGHQCVDDPLLTTAEMVTGAARADVARAGYVAVDMESGLISAPRFACVRVILDTPLREISPQWTQPWRALSTPALWGELPFLMREGPRCARIAARIVAEGLERLV